MGRRSFVSVAAGAVLGAVLVPVLPTAVAAGDVVVIEVESGRGDLVSGGDALLRVIPPDAIDASLLVVRAAGDDVTDAFLKQEDGTLLGLATGLGLGTNVVEAELPDGRGARITLTNAPQHGPVFSGPLIQPWTCANGSEDPNCVQDPEVSFLYQSTDPTSSGFQDYDPENPPGDVATTTTDEGNEVPFIVRQETGTSLRDQYRIAALHDPAQGVPDPAAENPGYANKLVLTHGASCDTDYTGASAPDVLLEDALGQGFAVASHALDNAGHNCNLVTQAESLVMTKEMVAERYGPITYTIGTGCSGGSLVLQQVGNAYPGVYQGILPQCTFTDAWSSAQQYVDYVGLRNYLEGPGSLEAGILPAQWPSIFGHANPANQITFTEAIPNSGDPSRSCTGVPPEDVFSADNPDGVRCSFQDYMVNVFGEDEDGKARRPISNVGVQYGLSGLLAFLDNDITDPTRPMLTVDQFVGLNAGVGGFDIDFEPIPERTAADPIAQERVYRSGAVNTGAHLDEMAIIDFGGPEPGAFHDVYRKYAMRDRLIREHGHSDNQVFWEGQTPLLGDVSFVDDGIRAMDEWLAAIEADDRDIDLAQKVLDAKDEVGIEERCVAANGQDAPLAFCDQTVDPTIFSSPRIEAGGGDQAPVNGVGPEVVGFTDDRLDCERMPLEDYDYAGQSFTEVFSEAQQETMRTTFPDGVCDYAKPGHGFQAATTWLTYQDAAGAVIFGGTPMGPAPVSVPYQRDPSVAPAPTVPSADCPDVRQAPVVDLGAASSTTERVSGDDRFATAVAVSERTHDEADVVVLATGRDFPDALAGGPYAASLDAPLLLTEPDEVPDVVRAELDRLGATRVVVLGGEAVVSADVASSLQQLGLAVDRIAGADRYDTAARIAAAFADDATTAFVTNGRRFPDALAASVPASRLGAPILLTEQDVLPSRTRAALAGLDQLGCVAVLGGEVAVALDVDTAVEDATGVVPDRLAGPDRYATAVAIARYDRTLQGAGPSVVSLATGVDFPDALAAGPAVAAANGTTLVLVDGRDVGGSPVAHAHLDALRAPAVTVYGGETAVTPAVVDRAARTTR